MGAFGYVLKSLVDCDLVEVCWVMMCGELFLYLGGV